jgi:hypothetical protein
MVRNNGNWANVNRAFEREKIGKGGASTERFFFHANASDLSSEVPAGYVSA